MARWFRGILPSIYARLSSVRVLIACSARVDVLFEELIDFFLLFLGYVPFFLLLLNTSFLFLFYTFKATPGVLYGLFFLLNFLSRFIRRRSKMYDKPTLVW